MEKLSKMKSQYSLYRDHFSLGSSQINGKKINSHSYIDEWKTWSTYEPGDIEFNVQYMGSGIENATDRSGRSNYLLLFFGLFIFLYSQSHAQMPPKPEIPEEMKSVDFIEGTWRNEAIFLSKEGEERSKSVFTSEITKNLDGRTYEIRSFHNEEPAGLSWFFYYPPTKQFTLVALDAWGNYDEFTGGWNSDKELVLTSKERVYGNRRKMIWRRTYYDIKKNKHKVKMYYSVDGGYSWILSNTQIETKQ